MLSHFYVTCYKLIHSKGLLWKTLGMCKARLDYVCSRFWVSYCMLFTLPFSWYICHPWIFKQRCSVIIMSHVTSWSTQESLHERHKVCFVLDIWWGVGILSREATLPFSFFPSISRDQLLKERMLLEEQILCFKSRPHFGRALSSREANKKSWKLFIKMPENLGGVPKHLKYMEMLPREITELEVTGFILTGSYP